MGNNLNKKKKTIINILLVPTAVIIASVLMIILYSLPTAQMKENVSQSISMYDGGSSSFNNWTNGKRYTALSNFTDTIMMNTAIFRPSKSAVENAMINAHAMYSETENNMDLFRIAQGEEGYTAKEYIRYWHGYLLYMIPALQVMDVGELKIVGMILQFFLTIILVYLLGKQSRLLMLLYGIVAIFINPVTTVLTFQEADIYCIMMISMIIILRYNEKLKSGWYFSFFLVNGIFVAFIDFLTYPLVALGVPLILVLLLDKFISIKEIIRKVIVYSIGWAVGYLGMWGGKWLISSILTGRNVFADAVETIQFRTHGEYNNMVTYSNTLKTIWDSINDGPMLIMLFIAITIIAIYLIKNRSKISVNRIGVQKCIGFLIIGIFPFAWYYVAMNHSVLHPWMSYRELSITIWAIAAVVFTLFKPHKDDMKNANG